MINQQYDEDASEHGLFASPPCLMHDIDPASGMIMPDAAQARDVARWRKGERERLIAARLALSPRDRELHSERVARDLDALVPRARHLIVSLYWPFRGEPDLRPWMERAYAAGLRPALPEVAGKGKPLLFRAWAPRVRLERGVWNIPYPADGDLVAPAVIIAPLVGFDRACYRLGYGGGFFDRTLFNLRPRPLVIGVGHESGAVATIYPQPHDIPMDWIVTGNSAPQRRHFP